MPPDTPLPYIKSWIPTPPPPCSPLNILICQDPLLLALYHSIFLHEFFIIIIIILCSINNPISILDNGQLRERGKGVISKFNICHVWKCRPWRVGNSCDFNKISISILVSLLKSTVEFSQCLLVLREKSSKKIKSNII